GDLRHVVVRVRVGVAGDAVAALAGVGQHATAFGAAAGVGRGRGRGRVGRGGGGVLGDRGGGREAQAGGDQQRSDHGLVRIRNEDGKHAARQRRAQSRQYSDVVNASPTAVSNGHHDLWRIS